jgi:diguanylate cyclase (GGDEF)-like protein
MVLRGVLMTKRDPRQGRATGRDFGGILTQYVVGYLRSSAPEGVLAQVLLSAGEKRSLAELSDATAWSSYAQYRGLLEATSRVLGGPAMLGMVGMHVFDSIQSPDLTDSMTALDSVEAVYAMLPSLSTTPAVELQTENTGPNEVRVRFRFRPGFEPFAEHCALHMGLFASAPRIFGYKEAEILHESCQCDGAPWCQARMHWDTSDDVDVRVSRAELRSRLSQARLEELQRTVAELVSGDDLETVLTRVVAAVHRAVPALSYILDIDASVTTDRWVCAEGINVVERASIDEGLHGMPDQETAPNVCAVGVESDRVRYGRLLVVRAETATFEPLERSVLESYARLAASAIRNARLLEEIRHQSLHDGLTGLPNRILIMDRVNQAISRARREHLEVAVMFIDLDGFKNVNDTLGHGVGDKLLQSVAARIAGLLRESDTVGRLGGDEFIVLTEGVSLAAGPELVAERLLEVLSEPYHLDGDHETSINISASIGIAVGLRESAEDFLRDADIALYAAKDAGKRCFVLFEAEMQAVLRSRHELELDLLAAVGTDQFFLLYQPIFDLNDLSVVGVEALLRWNHPHRGLLQPDDFIPALEASGLIVPVGRWVLLEACRQAMTWRQLGRIRTGMSVNVSARQMDADSILADVRHALATSGLPPGDLTVEITETCLMRNTTNAQTRLTALKSLGVRIAIDDFGTGYSSLAYLQKFPVDSLKIDRSFITGMSHSPEGDALLHTLMQLGKSLNLQTLAEGIEESGQLTRLQIEECDVGQGFLFARPLPADKVEAFLKQTKRSGAEVIS